MCGRKAIKIIVVLSERSESAKIVSGKKYWFYKKSFTENIPVDKNFHWRFLEWKAPLRRVSRSDLLLFYIYVLHCTYHDCLLCWVFLNITFISSPLPLWALTLPATSTQAERGSDWNSCPPALIASTHFKGVINDFIKRTPVRIIHRYSMNKQGRREYANSIHHKRTLHFRFYNGARANENTRATWRWNVSRKTPSAWAPRFEKFKLSPSISD